MSGGGNRTPEVSLEVSLMAGLPPLVGARQRFSRRTIHTARNMREPRAAAPSTQLTWARTAKTASRVVPSVAPSAGRRPYHSAHARGSGVGGRGGERRNEVLEGGEGRDQGVQRCCGQPLEEREKIAQTRACSSSATASAATPSPLPIQPIPSFVFALTETIEYPLTSAPARFSRMSSR